MDRHKLHNIGVALYGVPFRTTLAGHLGVDLGVIEDVLDGRAPVSDYMAGQAAKLVEDKIRSLEALIS